MKAEQLFVEAGIETLGGLSWVYPEDDFPRLYLRELAHSLMVELTRNRDFITAILKHCDIERTIVD